MKFVTYLLLACFLAPTIATASEESAKEKTGETAEAAGNSVKRGAKKAKNRVKEAFCTDSDLECKAKKAGHRVSEGAGKLGDKVDEKTE
jgi:hypothetical protein